MARKIPSLGSVLVMIAALIFALPAQAELQLFFVHNDHLSTPKYLTDTTGKAVWQAQATPFGEVTEKEDLDGDGKYVTLNMRFPGQYWDHEMGTSYNYFRDYDPSLGRYIQSDPIGLGGGINTYGYALQNPLKYSDPTGQFSLAEIAIPVALGTGFLAYICGVNPNLAMCKNIRDLANQCLNEMKKDTDKGCEALYQSTLKTCASLSGRKQFACFEAARINREQCYKERR